VLFIAYLQLRIKEYIRSNPTLYRLIAFLRKFAGQDSKQLLCNKNSALCLEAYPSSANAFLCSVLKYSNKDLNIARHTHSIANIKIALKYNIPVVIIIRDPLEAISSRVVRFKKGIERSIFEYLNFYEFVTEHLDRIVVVSFEDVVNNTSSVLRKIREKTNINLVHCDINEAKKHAFSTLTLAAKEHNRLHRIGLPSEEREHEKDDVKKTILESIDYQKTEALYEHISNLVT
jgi:hypothetical protein